MPFQRSSDLIERAISATIADDEINRAIQRAGISAAFLRRRLASREDEIWGTVGKEIDAFEVLDAEYHATRAVLWERVGRLDDYTRRALIFSLSFSVLVFVYLIFIFVFPYEIFPSFLEFLGNPLKDFVANSKNVAIYALAVLQIFLLVAVFWLLVRRRALARRKAELESKHDLSQLRQGVAEAKEEIHKALIYKGIRPLIREFVNAELQPSYSTTLLEVSGAGLAEVFDPIYEIPTAAKELLRHRLETMPGGSIGIAGPRGAGKTTLIRAFCSGFTGKIAERPVLSVMTAAPVQYDARDFILHLFSLVCRRLLRLEGVALSDDTDLLALPQDQVSDPLRRWLSRLTILLLLIAQLLILLGALLLWMNLIASKETVVVENAQTNISWLDLANALGLTPGPLVLWGLVFVIVSLGIYAYVRSFNRARNLILSEVNRNSSEALRWLQLIKFQQSFTSGWSGSLKLPVGFSGVLTEGRSFARQPLSLPEIVEGYRRFIDQISSQYLVIVGIDELDKMHSEQTAQNFLNEIKALFGIENCFYLVSASEGAMSAFERRGLPFRDAFDSAFDDILTVKYLDLSDAAKLLRRRVIGLPIPFLDLCYCLSGGLARDLIRACRGLLEKNAHQCQTSDLSGLTTALIHDDIEAKHRAISVIAKDIPLEPHVTAFLEQLHRLEGDIARTHDPADLMDTLFHGAAQIQEFTEGNLEAQGGVAENVAPHWERLGHLGLELASYLTYAATVLDIFALTPSEIMLKAAENTGVLDEIAKARQVFAINPGLSRSIISQVRARLHVVLDTSIAGPSTNSTV